MFNENLYAFNTLERDPNMRGEEPMVIQMVAVAGTLSSGTLATDNIASPFGKGKGVAIGGVVMNSAEDGAAKILGALVEVGTNDGTIKITISSSTGAATDAFSTTVLVWGKIQAFDPS